MTENHFRTVLIHLNIEVEADDDGEAMRSAEEYLRRHNVALDDVALVEVTS